MDFTLTDDQQAYVEAAAAFADEALKPHAARWDKEHEFPIPTIKQAAGLGFCGLYTPEQFGGLGLPRLDASLIFERQVAPEWPMVCIRLPFAAAVLRGLQSKTDYQYKTNLKQS